MADVPGLRILADDLTGALDTAAAFALPGLPVSWRSGVAFAGAGARDAATREGTATAAASRHSELSPWLLAGAPAFKKMDSLLRGHWAVEIAALVAANRDRRIVIAPAFPFQGRVTREGRQWRTDPPAPLGPAMIEVLQAAGVPVAADIVVRDAETDDDLDAIVAEESASAYRVLWVGTAGLAAALARGAGRVPAAVPVLSAPLLGLVGSHHPVTMDQIACAETSRPGCHVVLGLDGSGAETVAERLTRGQPCVATVAFEGGDRGAAASAIAERFAVLLDRCPSPGSLFVAGGETLRDIADALGASSLAVEGALEPGLPVSRFVGGRFDGLPVVSKSGAFGRPDLLGALFCRACPSVQD